MAPDLPKTYRHAVFKENGGPLIMEDAEMKLPEKGQILIKVEACGVCHSDLTAKYDQMGGGFPMTPGHEIIGRVVVVGDNVTNWKVGDRCGGPWHGGHDGSCKSCKKGLFQMCDNALVNGVTKPGGYAEYCILQSEAAVPFPDHLDAAKYAAIQCAGVTVFNSMRRMQISPGSLVAIQGLGGLGHLALQYANKFGFRVAALSRDGSKEKFARELGAHEYIDASKGDQGEALAKLGGAAMIVATAPSPKAISPLMKGLAPTGKMLIVAIAGAVEVDTITMVQKGLSVHSWPAGHPIDTQEAVEFTELTNVNCMIEKFPLEKAPEALDHMVEGKVRFRAVLVMDGSV